MSSTDAPEGHERSALRRAGWVLLFGLMVGVLASGLNHWLSSAGFWSSDGNEWFSVHWAMLAVGLGIFALSSLCAALPILLRPSLARPVVTCAVLTL